jgi:hypothetical protein
MKTAMRDTYSDYSRLRIQNLRKSLEEIETCHFIDLQDPTLVRMRKNFQQNIAELELDMAHRAHSSSGVPSLKIKLA